MAVSLAEITRGVLKSLTKEDTGLTAHQVHSVYKCIGKYISFMIKKAQYDWVVADITNFGTVVYNCGKTDFVPSNCLATETHLQVKMPKIGENAFRQELSLSKIS